MRKLLILTVLVFSILPFSSGTQAQLADCGQLSADDCAILNDSALVMNDLESGTFRFDMNLSLDDIPELGFPIRIRLNGGGSFRFDYSAVNNLPQTSDLPQAMVESIRAIAADTTMVLHFSDDLVFLGSMSGAELPTKVSFSARLLDGFLYLNLDKMMALFPDMPMTGWYSIDLASFYRQALEQPSRLFEASAANQIADPSAYTTVERLADARIEGQSMAVFKTTVDIGALALLPEFQTQLREQLEHNPTVRNTFPGSDTDEVLDAYVKLFQGMVAESTQSIGLDDHYVHRTALRIDWPLDLTVFNDLIGFSFADLPPLRFRLELDADLHDFNAAPAIVAPPNAVTVPLDSLIPGLPEA